MTGMFILYNKSSSDCFCESPSSQVSFNQRRWFLGQRPISVSLAIYLLLKYEILSAFFNTIVYKIISDFSYLSLGIKILALREEKVACMNAE